MPVPDEKTMRSLARKYKLESADIEAVARAMAQDEMLDDIHAMLRALLLAKEAG